MTDVIPFTTFREAKRLYSRQVVTTNGIFKEGQVPEEYEGDAELTVEVVHEIVMADSAGRLQRLVFDIPEALDKDKKNGAGYGIFTDSEPPVDVINPYTTDDYPLTTGGATEPTKLYIRENAKISDENKSRVDEMISISGGWPVPPTT